MTFPTITRVFFEEDISSSGAPHTLTGDELIAQRSRDRVQHSHLTFSGNPGGATTGTFDLYGRLSQEASFAPVYESDGSTQIQLDTADLPTTGNMTLLGAFIPTLPSQRWQTTDLTPSSASNRDISIWIIE